MRKLEDAQNKNLYRRDLTGIEYLMGEREKFRADILIKNERRYESFMDKTIIVKF
jgi:hypothetical protein